MNAVDPTVGKLRPTQVISQHGPGAVVDLPELSVVIASLDAWHEGRSDRVTEPRLEAFLGADGLYRPPRGGGVPAYVFPGVARLSALPVSPAGPNDELRLATTRPAGRVHLPSHPSP